MLSFLLLQPPPRTHQGLGSAFAEEAALLLKGRGERKQEEEEFERFHLEDWRGGECGEVGRGRGGGEKKRGREKEVGLDWDRGVCIAKTEQ